MAAQIRLTVDASTFLRLSAVWAHLSQVRSISLTTITDIPGYDLPSALEVTGVDLLSAIGRACTRPEDATSPAALFALLKYAESLAPGGSLALVDDIEFLDRHKKTVLSDEFGCGAALLIAERLLSTPQLLDVDTAWWAGLVDTGAPRSQRPDYVGVTTEQPTRVLVVEAKGTQSGAGYSAQQVTHGCEQLRDIVLKGAWTGLETLRVATGIHLPRSSQTVGATLTVSDPPAKKRPKHRLAIVDRTAPLRVHYARISALLGDSGFFAELLPERDLRRVGTDQETHTFQNARFAGVNLEIRGPNGLLRLFAGLDTEARRLAIQREPVHRQVRSDSGSASLSPDGFLLLISRD